MNLSTVNYWAVFAAALSAFVVGGLWYSPLLFANAWKRANGFSADSPAAGAKIFVLSFLFCVVMAFNLAMFLNDAKTTAAWGAIAGFLAGFGWAAMGVAVISLFERRPASYTLINGGYLTVALTLLGLILGAWR